MSAKHTPGPWGVVDGPDPIVIAKGKLGRGIFVAQVQLKEYVFKALDGPADPAADACLIAAAPDLLEALEKLLRMAGDPKVPFEARGNIAAREMARAAIQKARGE